MIIKKRIVKSNSLFLIVISLMTILVLQSIIYNLTNKTNIKTTNNNSKELIPEISISYSDNKPLISIVGKSKNSIIYYTLDSEEPTIESSKYTEPFIPEFDNTTKISNISTSYEWKPPLSNNLVKAVILKVKVLNSENEFGKTITKTIFKPEFLAQINIPVISLVTEKSNYFGKKKGIMIAGKTYSDKDLFIKRAILIEGLRGKQAFYPANFKEKGKKWHRKVDIEIISKNKISESVKASTRIYGRFSRSYSQKGIKVEFDDEKKSSDFNSFLTTEGDSAICKELLLRAWGTDNHSALIRDALANSIMNNTNVDIQDFQLVILLINGEYWGLYNLRDYNYEKNLSLKYNIPESQIRVISIDENRIYDNSNLQDSFSNLTTFMDENDIAIPENYEYIKSKINIPSFIDYCIIEIYSANKDLRSNTKLFKVGVSGKWTFSLKDLDAGFSGHGKDFNFAFNMYSFLENTTLGKLLLTLTKNEQFKNELENRYIELSNSNLSRENILLKIDQLENNLYPYIADHIDRWRYPKSVNEWQSNINMIRNFVINRKQYADRDINLYLNKTN